MIHNHDGDGGHDEDDPRTLSVITSIDQLFDSEEIGRFVSRAADGGFGEFERMKGIVRIQTGWIHLDVTSGRSSLDPLVPMGGEQAHLTAIGRKLDLDGLLGNLTLCYAATAT